MRGLCGHIARIPNIMRERGLKVSSLEMGEGFLTESGQSMYKGMWFVRNSTLV